MNECEWEQKFQPLNNHLVKSAPRCGDMFETFGEEFAFVQSHPSNYVWTWIEGDDHFFYIVNGFHLVNRIGYFVCKKPFEEDFLEVKCDW